VLSEGTYALIDNEAINSVPRAYIDEFYKGIGEGIVRYYDNLPDLYAGECPSIIAGSLDVNITEYLHAGMVARYLKVHKELPKKEMITYSN
jgi:hypothetical protein